MEGCSNLGAMYAKGEDVAKDKKEAARLYKKACDGGEGIACYNLGVMYRGGWAGVEPVSRGDEL